MLYSWLPGCFAQLCSRNDDVSAFSRSPFEVAVGVRDEAKDRRRRCRSCPADSRGFKKFQTGSKGNKVPFGRRTLSSRFDEAIAKPRLAIDEDPSFAQPIARSPRAMCVSANSAAREIVDRLREIAAGVAPDLRALGEAEDCDSWLSGLHLAVADATPVRGIETGHS